MCRNDRSHGGRKDSATPEKRRGLILKGTFPFLAAGGTHDVSCCQSVLFSHKPSNPRAEMSTHETHMWRLQERHPDQTLAYLRRGKFILLFALLQHPKKYSPLL